MSWKNTKLGKGLKAMTLLHESIKLKEIVIKESEGFRLRLQKWEVLSPKGTYAVNFVNESLDEDGNVWQSSTYNFFMTEEEIDNLCVCLKA
jgi:hypothetical protein